MNKEYQSPELNISMFLTDVCTDASNVINGVDIVTQSLNEKNIKNTESKSLSSFTLTI